MTPDPPGRVIRTPNVRIAEALIMPSSMFSDGKSRACVNDAMTDEQVAKLEQAIEYSEKMQRAVDAINAITARLHPSPAPLRRQAMILEFADGHREYSPEVEVIAGAGVGDITLRPIVPFRRIPEGEKNHA